MRWALPRYVSQFGEWGRAPPARTGADEPERTLTAAKTATMQWIGRRRKTTPVTEIPIEGVGGRCRITLMVAD